MENNNLSAFAFQVDQIPTIMTRLQNVASSARAIGLSPDVELMVMDIAPTAVLSALLDSEVREQENVIAVNIGNLHTLAFRMENRAISGVFEHHTGHLDNGNLDQLL